MPDTNENNIEETLVENLDTFLLKVNEAFTQVTAQVIETAPDLWNGFLLLIQLKGGFLLLASTLYLCAIGFYLIPFFVRWVSSMRCNIDQTGVGIGGFCVISLAVTPAVLTFFDFYNWVSLFFPEGAVMLLALEAVGIKI